MQSSIIFPEVGLPTEEGGTSEKQSPRPQSPKFLYPRAHQQAEAAEVSLSSEGSPLLPFILNIPSKQSPGCLCF